MLTQAGAAVPADGEWFDLFDLTIEARERAYRRLWASKTTDQLRRRARVGRVPLGRSSSAPGDETQLTVYWRALLRPDRIYAVFNHLRAADGAQAWQVDSWPQAASTRRNHWQEGESGRD